MLKPSDHQRLLFARGTHGVFSPPFHRRDHICPVLLEKGREEGSNCAGPTITVPWDMSLEGDQLRVARLTEGSSQHHFDEERDRWCAPAGCYQRRAVTDRGTEDVTAALQLCSFDFGNRVFDESAHAQRKRALN